MSAAPSSLLIFIASAHHAVDNLRCLFLGNRFPPLTDSCKSVGGIFI